MILTPIHICVFIMIISENLIIGFDHRTKGTCEISEPTVLSCKGDFDGPRDLKNIIQEIEDDFVTFELFEMSLDTLPDDIFHDMTNAKVERIVLDRISLELLNVPELGLSPFASISDTLKHFEVYDTTGAFAWNWTTISSIKGFSKLIVENSPIIFASNTLSSAQNLRFLQLTKTNIKWIHPKAFNNNIFLSICSLANNYITTVDKSMFPTPAYRLWNLDLSGNMLKSIPNDFFSEMNSLRELKLNHNFLFIVTSELLTPVWNNLTMFRLQGNSLNCISHCWIRSQENKPFFLDSTTCLMEDDQRVLLDEYFDEC